MYMSIKKFGLKFGKNFTRVHFVGIGGVGMSGIAELLINMGFNVSGSDIKSSIYTDKLQKLGCDISFCHLPSNVVGADVVVYSSAISEDNIEIVKARELGIPVIKRAEMLAELMRMKFGILISGSHGKTSTTSMCAILTHLAGLDPTIVIGGRLDIFGGNAKLGEGDFLVAEADESDGSFLKLFPTIAIITNIDCEHMNFYGSFENLLDAFVEFGNRVPFYGLVILCGDDENVKNIYKRIDRRKITYGFSIGNDIRGYDVIPHGNGYRFKVEYKGDFLGDFNTKIPGKHNVLNSLVLFSLAIEMGIDLEIVKKSLEIFSGVDRRFQIKGIKKGVTVIDDYAHHPSEIKTTFDAISDMSPNRVIAVFQPHRYTRVKELFEEFSNSFLFPDVLICTEIYSAGETPIKGLNGEKLYESIKKKRGNKKTIFSSNFTEIEEKLVEIVKPGDILVTLGAGDVYKVGENFLKKMTILEEEK